MFKSVLWNYVYQSLKFIIYSFGNLYFVWWYNIMFVLITTWKKYFTPNKCIHKLSRYTCCWLFEAIYGAMSWRTRVQNKKVKTCHSSDMHYKKVLILFPCFLYLSFSRTKNLVLVSLRKLFASIFYNFKLFSSLRWMILRMIFFQVNHLFCFVELQGWILFTLRYLIMQLSS